MKIHTMKQGSAAWHAARLGIPTASEFHRILTPKTRKPAAGAATYLNELLAAWILGEPIGASGDEMGGFVLRGSVYEAEARAWYEMARECDVERVGFVTRDDGLVGYSPDGLVGPDGAVEIKVPAAHVHVGYLLNPASLVADHGAQCHGGVLVAERAWIDLVSYSPVMPPVIQRIARDADYLAALEPALEHFIAALAAGRERLLAAGCTPRPPRQRLDDESPTAAEPSPHHVTAQLAALPF